MTKVLIYPSLDTPEIVEGTCDQRRVFAGRTSRIVGFVVHWLKFISIANEKGHSRGADWSEQNVSAVKSLPVLHHHYENTPIQIYWKFHHQKMKIFRLKKSWYFSYFWSKQRMWVLLRTASARRFSWVPITYILSRNKRNNIYPSKPQFYYIKMGFKGVKVIWVCFRDDSAVSIFFGLL